MANTKRVTKQQRRSMPWKSKSVYRTRQDIASWNRAINMAQNAETPRMWPLQLLYNEILSDALLKSQVENRKQQVFSSGFNLKDDKGEVNEEATKLLKQNRAIAKIFDAILESRLRGYSVVELDYDPDGRLTCDIIPRTNIVPQLGLFYKDYADDLSPVNYRELREYGTWVLEFTSEDLGLLNSAVPHVLFKRFAQSCWSELCEIYGIPPRVLKTNTQDDAMLNRGEQMMKDMGAAAYFIIDETEELAFAQGVSTNGDVYKNLITFCNQETSLLITGAILGQDTEHGTRGKEQVSQDIQWLLVQSDMNLIETYFKDVVMPALVRIGFIPDGLTFEFDEAEDTNKLFEYTQKLLTHYDVDPEWIKAKFGVEVTAKKQQAGNNGGLAFFHQAPAVTTGADNSCCGNHITLAAVPKRFSFSDKAFIKRLWDAEGKRIFDYNLFSHTANVLTSGFKKGYMTKDSEKLAVGITYDKQSPVRATAYEMNLFRFSAAKTLAEAQELNSLFRRSTSFDLFYINATLKTEVYNKAWLKTEYHAALRVGAAASSYQRLLSTADVYPFWEYQTVEDDAVRPEHQKLHGIVLPWDDPRWDKIFPPNGWNCRCYVLAKMRSDIKDDQVTRSRDIVDAFFETDEWKKAKKSGWGVNRALAREVFSENQFYIDNFFEDGSKAINQLKPSDYNLKEYDEARKIASYNMPDYKRSADDFLNDLEDRDNEKVLTDYSKRPILAPTSSVKASDANLLQAMNETIQKPNEVWMNGKDLESLIYIKYYQDKTLIVHVSTNGGKGLSVIKWTAISKASDVEKSRSGLLIKEK